MKRKYNVISKKGIDVSEIDADLLSQTSSANIPDRVVEVSSSLKQSKRVTTFFLDDKEAEQLKSDNRVLDVELDISELDDVSIVYHQISTHDFNRNSDETDANLGNWGLKRHAEENLNNYNTDGSLTTGNESLEFNMSGEGVDIVIWDTGLDASHPDFNNPNGTSRVQQINWWDVFLEANNGVLDSYYDNSSFALSHEPYIYYRDYSGHGTSCASVAAGNRFGIAKKAHIYLAKQNEGGVVGWNQTALDWLNTLIYWHNNKGNDRPTIINNSWGYVTRGVAYSEVTGGRFRLNANDDYTVWNNIGYTDEYMANYAQMRINGLNLSTTNPDFDKVQPNKNSAFDTLLQEAFDAGIHIFNAAGNYSDRIVKPDHPEYDNFVNATHTSALGTQVEREIYYNRGGSPYLEDAFHVGAISEDIDNTAGKKDDITYFSGRGGAVDMYCATNCGSAQSSDHADKPTTFTYPDDANFKARIFGGTSCATPNAVGVAACYLSAIPTLTPAQLKTKMISDAKSDILYERSGSWNSTNPFLDSNNTIMYNRYNQNVGITATNVKIDNATFGNLKKETILNGAWDIATEYLGFNVFSTYSASLTGFTDPSVVNIYKDGKILSLYNKNIGNQQYEYVLKFDGEVHNGGWEWVEFYNPNGFESYSKDVNRFYRKDAKWHHVKKEFSWIVSVDIRNKSALFGDTKVIIN